jgi:hypothetical protein
MSEQLTTPKIADIYAIDSADKAFKQDSFNWVMNQQPNPKWVKENKFAGNSKYIPIGTIETMLQMIVKEFKIEILREGHLFNSVFCTIRLHYISPVTGEWSYFDGTGAAELQTKQGASAADLGAINKGAVMMALPMAKSYAIKDAAEHFGALFGRDLNRKDVMNFVPSEDTKSKTNHLKELVK